MARKGLQHYLDYIYLAFFIVHVPVMLRMSTNSLF